MRPSASPSRCSTCNAPPEKRAAPSARPPDRNPLWSQLATGVPTVQTQVAPKNLLQKQEDETNSNENFLVLLPETGLHLKATPSNASDNFPGDLAMSGDIVIIKNTGGAATYKNVRDGTWAWIEIPGKSSPDPKYPTLHGFIETRFIAGMRTGPATVTPQKPPGPYNDCKDSPTDPKYSVIKNGSSSSDYQNEIDRLEKARGECPDWGGSIDARVKSLQKYKAERGNSTLADCSFSMTFDGLALDCGPGGNFLAVSGEKKTDGSGEYFDYSAKAQQQPGGPIPEGVYWLNPDELKDLGVRRLLDKNSWPEKAWGSHAITIHPFETTPTFGRGGFFIHGGEIAGSIGCIDVTNNMDKVADAVDDVDRCKIKLTIAYRSARMPA